VGKIQARRSRQARGKGTIIMIKAPRRQQRQAVQAGAHSVLDSSGIKIAKEYDTPTGRLTRPRAEMEQAITAVARASSNGVYAANDGTAGGAIAAMRRPASTRRRSRPPVRTQSWQQSSASSPAISS